jgi:hypothetical protein
MRVAFFEPWYGGSHRAFLDAWCRHSGHEIAVHGLKPRHWKWRQEASAWELARCVAKDPAPDLIACSDFVDLPRLMGFLPPAWAKTPTLLYFHENQLTYRGAPATAADEDLPPDFTHGFSNVLSAIRASTIVFNSTFHRTDFEAAGLELLRRLPRPNPRDEFAERMAQAHVVAPLPELDKVPLGPGGPEGSPLRLVFPHRLEADKDPCTFFHAVLEASAHAHLEVVLLGGDLSRASAPIREAAAAIAPLIIHEGHCDERRDYLGHLGAADVVVSTARHEFFGVAFAEAMAAGCTPLAPDRLNYPDLVARSPEPREALFGPEDPLGKRLMALADPNQLARIRSRSQRAAMARAVSGFGALEGSRALDAIVSGSVSAM